MHGAFLSALLTVSGGLSDTLGVTHRACDLSCQTHKYAVKRKVSLFLTSTPHVSTTHRATAATIIVISDTSSRLLEEARQMFEAVPTAAASPAATAASAAGMPTRLAVAVSAIATVVAAGGANDPLTVDLCKAFIAHAAMLELFPPDRRASTLPDVVPSTAHLTKLGSFLQALWSPLRDALIARESPDGSEASVAAECLLSDLWDGRFLTRLIIAASAAPSLGLPASTMATIDKALAAAGVPGPLEPLCRNVAAPDAAACKEVMDVCATKAVELGTFTDAKIPRYVENLFDLDLCLGTCGMLSK